MCSTASRGSESCRARLLYIDPVCDGDSLLRAAMVAAHSLIISNDVRRGVCVEAYARLAPGCEWIRLSFDSSRVRGLAVQETALRGLVASLLRGDKWPGIRLEEEPPSRHALQGCATARRLLVSGIDECPACILVEGSMFKPWWEAAAAMVAWDERCGGCGGHSSQG